jgi:hypothetical protein
LGSKSAQQVNGRQHHSRVQKLKFRANLVCGFAVFIVKSENRIARIPITVYQDFDKTYQKT